MYWRHAGTVIFLQVMSYGGGVHVHALRQLRRLYAVQKPSLPSLET